MIAGRYTLDREIGRGGMGAVWLGVDEVLGRPVALKQVGMVAGAGSPDLERAEREARLAARLNHPHVVGIYDLVADGEQQWLVMEYVDGMTLAALVRQDGALTPDRAAPILGQAAAALAAAHAAGIVHRDVKPSNILLTSDGQARLSDFGIARAQADASLTQTGLVTGSPAYLAPEVASGATATAASDVWSLGATLHHALAGHPPYDAGDNVLGALYRIVHEEPPRLDNAGWLGPLLAATMTREPADRWPMARVRDFLLSGPTSTPLPIAASDQVTADPVTGRTQMLSQAAPPATPPPTTPPTIPATAPVPPRAAPPGRRRGTTTMIALVVAIIAVAALIGWLLLSLDDPSDQPATDPTPSATTPTPTPSPTPKPTPSAEAEAVTAEGMTSFVEDYLATVTTDPAAAWKQLTPDFQAQSDSYASYRGFWSGIRSATVTSAQADPETLQISYTVDYVRQDGSTTTDDVTLQLEGTDGSYRIAGES